MESNPTYHIIGGGVAGLYAAKLLKHKGKIVLYEAAEKIGGRCGSCFLSQLDCQTDMATHVVLNRNKYTRQIIGAESFCHKIKFFDLQKKCFLANFQCLPEIKTAIFNTANPAIPAQWFVLRKLWPFVGFKAYFSAGDLQKKLCEQLLIYADEIQYHKIWQGVQSKDGKITELLFADGNIEIKPQDKIISAIDSFNYNKIMSGYDFSYNGIANIVYRTSMALTLPQQHKMLGIHGGQMQWLFTTPEYTAVTISQTNKCPDAREIWQEICDLRNYNAAFMPQYQTFYYPRATICQDAENNSKRPTNARTQYSNLFICGDWTMKNQPCCIETAINSAIRAVRTILA